MKEFFKESINNERTTVLEQLIEQAGEMAMLHPSSVNTVRIKGFQIPDWEEVCNLAIEAQKKYTEARLIGWDFAYTNEGWVMVEANGHTMFIGQQIADQKGKKKEFEGMIHYNELKKAKESK